MVAIVLPTDTPPHPSPPLTTLRIKRSNSTFFQNMVMLHIKLKGATNPATWYQVFCAQTPTPYYPWVLSEYQSSISLELGHGAYNIKGNRKCSSVVASILPIDSPLNPATQGMGSKGQSSTLSEHGNDACQIKENGA